MWLKDVGMDLCDALYGVFTGLALAEVCID